MYEQEAKGKHQSEQGEGPPRKLTPSDIQLPPGYEIDVFADELTTPINITFTDRGEMFVADSGITDGNGKVLKLTDQGLYAPVVTSRF